MQANLFIVADTKNMDANRCIEAIVAEIKKNSYNLSDQNTSTICRKPVYWWTPETAKLHKTSNHLRREYQRKIKKTSLSECIREKTEQNQSS